MLVAGRYQVIVLGLQEAGQLQLAVAYRSSELRVETRSEPETIYMTVLEYMTGFT
jgi:hypothetical protein